MGTPRQLFYFHIAVIFRNVFLFYIKALFLPNFMASAEMFSKCKID